MLDARCGTLVSAAKVHAQAHRTIVVVDLSLDMLKAGRDRLRAAAGDAAKHFGFLQADLRQLPLQSRALGAVLSPGMLHLFADVEGITRELARVNGPCGPILSIIPKS